MLVSNVIDVVTKREARSGLPWESLYADDLLMATTRGELRKGEKVGGVACKSKV